MRSPFLSQVALLLIFLSILFPIRAFAQQNEKQNAEAAQAGKQQGLSGEIVSVKKIWDASPHNAFTDLVRFQDAWYCVFREGAGHVSPDGALRVIRSKDGDAWESAALIKSADSDLRDAKITVTPDGRLMLSGAEALHDQSKKTHQSLTWFSNDGSNWSEPNEVADPDFWLWRTTWFGKRAYGVGYGCRDHNRQIRLYQSEDGKSFTPILSNMFSEGYPNETSIVFTDRGLAYCLLRRDGNPKSGLIGIADPPYVHWRWTDLKTQIGGPHMILLPDGRLVAAVRLYDNKVRTSLCWVDPVAGSLTEFTQLPSGGDTSYAGLALHEGLLWVSYYSSHEGKTSIYLAKVKLPEPPAKEESAALPDFPRENVAKIYEVDPTWPKKPAEYVWEAMPGIAVDQQDNIWTFTRSTPPVQVYRPDGTFVRAWGDRDIGSAHHLKIDGDGNVWISDIKLHVVRKFSPGGEILLTIGTPGEAGCDQTHLNMPTDMAISPSGDVFVSDGYGNNRVVHFDSKGKFIKAWGEMGTARGQFSLPHAIAMDRSGKLYVADRNNVRVQIFEQDGKLHDVWDNLIVPWGLYVTADDEIWVCGSSPMPWRDDAKYPGAPLSCPPKDQIVMKFTTSGKVSQLWTIPKGEDGRELPGDVNWLHCIAVDSRGNLYLGDIIGKRAQKFTLLR